jgi:hypothetical protein
MSKFRVTLSYKELLILKHALEKKITDREMAVVMANCLENSTADKEQLQKDLQDETKLYEKISGIVETLREEWKHNEKTTYSF